MNYRALALLLAPPLLTAAVACGGDDEPQQAEFTKDPFDNYDQRDVTFIGDGTTLPSGEAPDAADAPDAPDAVLVAQSPQTDAELGCIRVSAELCVDPAEQGGTFCNDNGATDGPVDVIVVDGEIVDVICYPPANDPNRPVETVDVTTEGAVDVVQNANATTIVFDPATDGMPIEADISIDGNKVALYGNGPDNTIIDGDVILDGNNPRIRGVTVLGNVIIKKNSGAIVLSVIHGNIELQETASNNNVFVENDIYGDVIVPSNNNIFSGNDVQGQWQVTGSGNLCDRNYAFADDNGDFVIDDAERGDPLACP